MITGDSQGGDAVKRMQMLDAKKTLLASKNDEYKELVGDVDLLCDVQLPFCRPSARD